MGMNITEAPIDTFDLEKLELRNLISMRVSNRIIPPSKRWSCDPRFEIPRMESHTICIYIYIYIYISYTHTCIHIAVRTDRASQQEAARPDHIQLAKQRVVAVFLSISIYLSIYRSFDLSLSLSIYRSLSLSMYIYIYVCVYIYIYI